MSIDLSISCPTHHVPVRRDDLYCAQCRSFVLKAKALVFETHASMVQRLLARGSSVQWHCNRCATPLERRGYEAGYCVNCDRRQPLAETRKIELRGVTRATLDE